MLASEAGIVAGPLPIPVLPLPAIPLPSLPHIDLAGSLVSAITKLITNAVQGFGSWAFAQLSRALLATTEVPLGASFDGPWRAMLAVSALVAVPILLLGTISEVLAGRPSQALRRGLLMPLLIGPVLLASRAVLGLVLALVQGACGLLVQVGIGGNQGFAEGMDRMRQLLHIATGPADPIGAGASLIVVLLAGFLAFIIWIELACRAALVLLLAAFVPLALSGLFWHATARWTRRLIETLAAVVLAPLVITMVMVLAAATLTPDASSAGDGIDRVAVALALLFLGSLGLPMTFRLLPHVAEAALVAGAGASIARRAQRGARQVIAAAPIASSARLAAPVAGGVGASIGAAAGAAAGGAAGTRGSGGGAGRRPATATSAASAASRYGPSSAATGPTSPGVRQRPRTTTTNRPSGTKEQS